MQKLKTNLLSKDTVSVDFNITKTVERTEAEGGGLVISGYANTTDKDRAGDIILRSAWEAEGALANYKQNPILLAFHDHSKPIGNVTSFEITDKGLWVEASISRAAPDNLYDLVKDGVLRAFSVGFRALEVDYDESENVFVIKELELHEISIVAVPCNQYSVFSLVKGMNSATIKNLLHSITPKKVPEKVFQTEVEKLLHMLHTNTN